MPEGTSRRCLPSPSPTRQPPSTPPPRLARKAQAPVSSSTTLPARRAPKRTLSDTSDGKEPAPKKRGRPPSKPATPAAVVASQAPEKAPAVIATPALSASEEAALAAIIEEFRADFDHHAVPADSRRRLAPVIQRWGKGRVTQILGLWTFLGDGAFRSVSASTLQVWGPSGTGKTAIVSDYLGALNIRHIRLNCAAFTSLGELNGRLIELLQRNTASAAGVQLQRTMPAGQYVRSLDKMETLVRTPLQALSQAPVEDSSSTGPRPASAVPEAPVKIVVVLDQAQELPNRFGAGALDLLINLPEVLQWGNQLAVVVIGLLRLGSLGLHPNREPPAVAFQAYTEAEAEAALKGVLVKEFSSAPAGSGQSSTSGAASSSKSSSLAPADVCTGLMKFAWPHLGRNLQQLLSVGRQLLREGLPEDAAGGACGAVFQDRVARAVQQRLGVCDLRGLLKRGTETDVMDTATVAAIVTLKQMTKAEMRLILSAYLAGYVEKEDDLQLFMPQLKRKVRRKTAVKQQQESLPIYTRAPRATSLSRLLAVYHRLARRPQLLGPPIFEHLAGLREAGLLRFPAERACLDQDVKVTCRAQLPLVRAIAAELNIDMAEYLDKY